MTNVAVYNSRGEQKAPIEVREDIFGVKPNSNLIHQVYVALRANARQPLAHTKMRGDVRGGGKKPWKQKGTGRARHGSIRSPLWRGGGVTFGPLSERNYTQKINKKMKVAAVKMVLSDKVAHERLMVIDTFEFNGKAQEVARLRATLPGSGKTTVFVVAEHTPELVRAAQNVPAIDVVRAADINVVDLLHHQYVVVSADAIAALEKRFVK